MNEKDICLTSHTDFTDIILTAFHQGTKEYGKTLANSNNSSKNPSNVR